ncbi:hypothetical protein D3C84_1179120 [compost metagenome]
MPSINKRNLGIVFDFIELVASKGSYVFILFGIGACWIPTHILLTETYVDHPVDPIRVA